MVRGQDQRRGGAAEHICLLWDGALRQVFATGEDVAVASVFPAPGRRTRHYEGTLAPEFAADDSARVETVLVFMRDVTSHKRAQADLVRAREQALAPRVPRANSWPT